MQQYVEFKTTKGKEEKMSIETYARWLCLLEAMEVINNTAERKNINLNKTSDWIKPIALQKYIDERFPSMLHDVKCEEAIEKLNK
jgi:hypothetical protein